MPQTIEVPGMGEVEFPDYMTHEQISAAIQASGIKFPSHRETPEDVKARLDAKYGGMSFMDKVKGDLGSMRDNVAAPLVRGAIKGVNSIPTMAADAGVAVRNLFPGQNYELPSQMYEREVFDRYLPTGGAPGTKSLEFGASLAAGSMMQAPQVKNPAPANFGNARQQARDAVLMNAQREGYVTPPSANNPTAMNRILEGVAGKLKVGQEAAIRNQSVTDKLVARSLGQNADAPITQGALQTIRGQAHAAGYEPVKAAGEIVTDQKFLDALTGITKTGANASRSFPGLKPQGPIDDIVKALAQAKFDAGDGIDATRHLRELADQAYGAGNSVLGRQYKEASKAVEDMLERGLESKGKDGAELLKGFRDARTLMAKTFTAGKALTDDVGSSNARSYANEMLKGKPLTGDQRLMGQFASTFGKYTPKPTGENFPSLSPLDVYGSAGVSAAAGNPLPLLYPFGRTGLREYLLSQRGQSRAFAPNVTPRPNMGPYAAPPLLGAELQDLLAE